MKSLLEIFYEINVFRIIKALLFMYYILIVYIELQIKK